MECISIVLWYCLRFAAYSLGRSDGRHRLLHNPPPSYLLRPANSASRMQYSLPALLAWFRILKSTFYSYHGLTWLLNAFINGASEKST